MSKSLQLGDVAPDFERPDQSGRPFRLSSLRGRCVVVYFYPRDGTPACTKESCQFRDAYEDFVSAGAAVVGISTGTSDEHARFAERHALPFTLIADDGSIRRAWGVRRWMFILPGRATFVVDAQGVVRHVFKSPLNVTAHVAEALNVVRRLESASTRS